MLVIKRNKSVENFDWKKVEKVIVKAFNAVNEPINQATLNEIRDELSFNSITSVEEIQDQIEYALMTLDYCNVAKAFILYRNKQTENRVLDQKVKFIHDYTNASNAATGSRFDPNANVTEKNVATLTAELYKGDIIKLESHELYKHDETSIMPYCVAITMYPFLLNGLQDLGGLSAKPKNLDSFCGIFINLCFAVSSQFAGALATGEFLMYFDYFARKEWGDDYYKYSDANCQMRFESDTTLEGAQLDPINSARLTETRTIEKVIEQKFQQIVYSMNQPAAARGFQSIFWNISYFDKNYFDGMFGDFYFPEIYEVV